MKLPIGKLDNELLKEKVFRHITYQRPEVKQRPGIGEDCAVVAYGEYDCILSTDPITGAISEIGRLAINVTLNDIASNGVQPLGIMLAVMLPEGTTAEDVERIMKQAGETAASLQVEIIGGHTEITKAVSQPVIVSTAIGRCLSGHNVHPDQIRAGDSIFITRQAGQEGVGILASDRPDKLENLLTPEELQQAKDMLLETSVLKEGLIAGEIGVSGMHDVTEGGILGAVWEVCEASGLGAEIHYDQIPISDLGMKVCNHLKIDILRLISSGCMLIVVSEEKSEKLQREIQQEKIQITRIGKMTQNPGRYLVRDGQKQVIAPPESDELYRGLK